MRPDLATVAVDASFQVLGIAATITPPAGAPEWPVLVLDARPDQRLQGDGFSVNTGAGRFEVRVAELAAALASATPPRPERWVLRLQTTPVSTWLIDKARIEDPARLKWTLTASQIG